jgi:hypothetical protein
MPLMLDPDSYDVWLDPGMQNVAAISDLLKPSLVSRRSLIFVQRLFQGDKTSGFTRPRFFCFAS